MPFSIEWIIAQAMAIVGLASVAWKFLNDRRDAKVNREKELWEMLDKNTLRIAEYEERINQMRDEIALLKTVLRDNGIEVPEMRRTSDKEREKTQPVRGLAIK